MTETAARGFPTRRFAASRISQAIDGAVREVGFAGRVEGIYRTAVNLDTGAQLVTVAHASHGGLPNGILVDPPVAFDRMGLAPGMLVRSDGASLSVPEAALLIDLSRAASWSPRMRRVSRPGPSARLASAERALAVAADHASQAGLGPLLLGIADGRGWVGPYGEAVAGPLADVIEALNQRAMDRAVAAARRLIGLGPGATPSGDDLLVGLAAGLAVTGDPRALPFASGVAAEIGGLTTSVAHSYLVHAGRLEFAERVQVTAIAILTAGDDDLRRAVRDALAWGASSGLDLALGLLIAIGLAAPGLAQRVRAFASHGRLAA